MFYYEVRYVNVSESSGVREKHESAKREKKT